MQLIYELTSPQELTKTEKAILALKREDFFFIRYKGVLKINKTLPKPKTLAQIAAAMWEFDQPLDCSDEAQIDSLWQSVSQIAGDHAAMQIYKAWMEALKEKQDAEDKAAATKWLQDRDIPDELDAIGTYSSGFIKALWSQTISTDAVFLYGYQLGMEAARKAV